MSDLEKYRERIKFVSQERIGEPIFNGSPDHAAIIIEELFLLANSTVRILSKDLNSRVYGSSGIVQKAKEFLGHDNRTLHILLEEKTYSDQHPLIEVLRGHDNVDIRLLPERISSVMAYHFATADTDCYRFQPDKSKAVAVAAFGTDAKSTTENLISVFESIWDEPDLTQIAL